MWWQNNVTSDFGFTLEDSGDNTFPSPVEGINYNWTVQRMIIIIVEYPGRFTWAKRSNSMHLYAFVWNLTFWPLLKASGGVKWVENLVIIGADTNTWRLELSIGITDLLLFKSSVVLRLHGVAVRKGKLNMPYCQTEH